MSTDTDGPGDGDQMKKIDVRVSDWLNPSPELSDEILDELEESRKQREWGKTVSAAEARERLGLDGEQISL